MDEARVATITDSIGIFDLPPLENARPATEADILEDELALLFGIPTTPEERRGSGDLRIKEYRKKVHALEVDSSKSQGPVALCLSGGGIRAAAFSLGTIQAFAKLNQPHSNETLLSRFNYLSTVSGGGYVGSWLTAWIARYGFTAVVRALRNPRGSGLQDSYPLNNLRSYANYLSPVWGLSLDFVTLVSIYLRNLLLNWIVLIPGIATALLVPKLFLDFTWRIPGPETHELQLIGLWMLYTAGQCSIFYGLPTAYYGLPGESMRLPLENRSTYVVVPTTIGSVLMFVWLASSLGAAEKPLTLDAFLIGELLTAFVTPSAVGWALAQWFRKQASYGAPINPLSGMFAPLAYGLGAGGASILALFLSTRPTLFPRDMLFSTITTPRISFIVLYTPLLFVSQFIGTVCAASTTATHELEGAREWWGRAGAWWLTAAAVSFLILAVSLVTPEWLYAASHSGTIASLSGLSGIVSALGGYFTKSGLARKGAAVGILDRFGNLILILCSLFFLLSVLLAINFFLFLHLEDPPKPFLIEGLVAICSFLLSFSVAQSIGVNSFSLHSLYGNRLIRAFLGASCKFRTPHPFTGFDPNDNVNLAAVSPIAVVPGPLHPTRKIKVNPLFHVVNMTLNLVDPSVDNLGWQERKAAPMTASSRYVGASIVGYRPTRWYTNGFTLGRAMTISGAAVSPNMGYHSSTLVSMVMMLFNIRLGWWLPNPGLPGSNYWQSANGWMGYFKLLSEGMSKTRLDSKYVYTSDGGHFENLGIFEMVRRRCRVIVVIDASCDPNYEYGDLANAMRKIRVDFGLAISFVTQMPNPTTQKIPIAFARIPYSDVDEDAQDGCLIYIKPLISESNSLDLIEYAADQKRRGFDFPHHSTADQFFDETKFESYRRLGFESIVNAFPELPPLGDALALLDWAQEQEPLTLKPPASAPVTSTGTSANVLQTPFSNTSSLAKGALAALTIGGSVALTATVTVALKPGTEISLSKTDRQSMADTISAIKAANLSLLQVKKAQAHIQDLLKNGGQEIPSSLQTVLEQISTSLSQDFSSKDSNDSIQSTLGRLEGNLKDIRSILQERKRDQNVPDKNFQEILTALQSIAAELKGEPNSTIPSQITGIQKSLDRIERKRSLPTSQGTP